MASRKPVLYRIVGRLSTNGHRGSIRRRDRALGVGAYAHCDTCDWNSPVYPELAKTRRHLHVALNRYPGVVIGIAVQVGHRVLSIVWGRPGRMIKETSDA